jgi:hypothetical protein
MVEADEIGVETCSRSCPFGPNSGHMSYDMTSVRSLLLKADIPSNSAIFSPRLAARSIVTSGLLWGLGTQRFTSMPLGAAYASIAFKSV